MIINGGIYSIENEVRVVFDLDADSVFYYSLDFHLTPTIQKEIVNWCLSEDTDISILKFNIINKEKFEKNYDGFCGKIDEKIRLRLFDYYFWND